MLPGAQLYYGIGDLWLVIADDDSRILSAGVMFRSRWLALRRVLLHSEQGEWMMRLVCRVRHMGCYI